MPLIHWLQVEGFWSYYNHVVRPNDLPNSTDLHLFKEGVKPMWEDEENRKGGKWILRMKKGLASRQWEDLLLALVGGQMFTNEGLESQVCGAVMSVRFQEDIISVWTKDATDLNAKTAIRDALKSALHLQSSVVMEYKAHDASIKDNSSFRNTSLSS